MSRKDTYELVSIQQKYIDSLIKNNDKCFESSEINGVLITFGIFNPVQVPGTDNAFFKAYGKDRPPTFSLQMREKSQWNQMQYRVNENVKKAVPEEVRNGTNDSSTA